MPWKNQPIRKQEIWFARACEILVRYTPEISFLVRYVVQLAPDFKPINVGLRKRLSFSAIRTKHKASVDTGVPSGVVPQNICSAVEIQLTGKLITAADFSWEFRTFSSISSRAGWIVQKTGGDWKNTSVGTSCKKNILLRPLDKVIAFVEKQGFEFARDRQDWCFVAIQILQRNDYS